MVRDRANVSVLVADDHPMFRVGLSIALRALGFGRVDVASDGLKVVKLAALTKYDVVLLDIRMPGMSGLEAAAAITAISADSGVSPPVVAILTTFTEPALIQAAQTAGARAFIGKETEPEALAAVVDDLAAGRFAGHMPVARVPTFSDRESEVLRSILAGQTTKEIAQSLMISPETVKDHVGRVYAKLEVRDRVGAVNEARRLGWDLLSSLPANAQGDR